MCSSFSLNCVFLFLGCLHQNLKIYRNISHTFTGKKSHRLLPFFVTCKYTLCAVLYWEYYAELHVFFHFFIIKFILQFFLEIWFTVFGVQVVVKFLANILIRLLVCLQSLLGRSKKCLFSSFANEYEFIK